MFFNKVLLFGFLAIFKVVNIDHHHQNDSFPSCVPRGRSCIGAPSCKTNIKVGQFETNRTGPQIKAFKL